MLGHSQKERGRPTDFAYEYSASSKRDRGRSSSVSFDLPGLAARAGEAPGDRRTSSRCGEMDVYDIQTESGEYLSAGGLRVHNCFILSRRRHY